MIIQNGVGITSLLNGETLKQTLDPANETVSKGIFEVTTLSAVDADLTAGNIKDGITLFGFAGTLVEGTDISDADAAVGDVKNTVTFYSVAEPKKTGTMPTVALVAGSDAYPAGYHAGDGGGLDAVDTDLTSANIKDGVTIFGKLGTFAGGALVEDVIGSDFPGVVGGATFDGARQEQTIASGADWNAATTTPTFAAGSRAVGVAFAFFHSSFGDSLKARLVMGGVQVAESSYIVAVDAKLLVGTRALSGAQSCVVQIHNYAGVSRDLRSYGPAVGNTQQAIAIAVGSIKT